MDMIDAAWIVVGLVVLILIWTDPSDNPDQ